jgi:predicted acyl esterase
MHHSPRVAGTSPGQRQLNGPQTTGREYRNLSTPDFAARSDLDVAIPMRDGIELLADVHRPDGDGRFPALLSASPYPRQIQDLGAPMGFIEAGATDFFVPRGYAHVIANVRGTGGSGGEFTFLDPTERRDLHELVEWVAAQPWCDGNVGMVGISYFAMSQIAAALERPPHLRAIFPLAASTDIYEAAYHHGLFSSSFISPFLSMVGITSSHGDELWRSRLVDAARHVLRTAPLHAKFATMNGEASVAILAEAASLPRDAEPWDSLWRSVAVEHPLRDEFWDDRDMMPGLASIDIPVYLGCDWQNVPLHLPSTFPTFEALTRAPEVRVAMLGEHGLTWPWESLHVEALAWFDHWLKKRDTGILDGPPIRYWMSGADEWRSADAWPPRGTTHRTWSLAADGSLTAGTAAVGERSYLSLGPGLNRSWHSPTDPPSSLTWTSEPVDEPLDIVGDIELVLDATITASDTGWIVTLRDVAADGSTAEVTAGWMRASLRDVDDAASRPGRPVLPCRRAEAVPAGEQVRYRIPLVATAMRLLPGHRLQLHLSSDDQPDDEPAIMGFRHAPVATTSRNTIASTSHVLLPIQS